MKTRIVIGVLSILSITSTCMTADATSTPGLSSTPTNAFSNWVGASSNLTVYARTAPWGRTLTATTTVKAGNSPRLPRELLEQKAAEKARERAREKILNAPPFMDTYHVHLGDTNSPAKPK